MADGVLVHRFSLSSLTVLSSFLLTIASHATTGGSWLRCCALVAPFLSPARIFLSPLDESMLMLLFSLSLVRAARTSGHRRCCWCCCYSAFFSLLYFLYERNLHPRKASSYSILSCNLHQIQGYED
ncbi:hypothetical protein BVRB_2g040140 isoform B [Beta vulgaris subsp. vulgaris]|nr:hypothetical protein BVRB_2g040140 isoform B [Beta vulgaris subsp. vulgaris]